MCLLCAFVCLRAILQFCCEIVCGSRVCLFFVCSFLCLFLYCVFLLDVLYARSERARTRCLITLQQKTSPDMPAPTRLLTASAALLAAFAALITACAALLTACAVSGIHLLADSSLGCLAV